MVTIHGEGQLEALHPHKNPPGRCIDLIDIHVQETAVDSRLLFTQETPVEEILYSHILRTYCPITHQPDWASVIVAYKGQKITEESLLRYLCSYRNHEGFAEQCCERIYADIITRCAPARLMVSCLYTRRGGIDINPVRANYEISPYESKPGRLSRQ